MTSRRRPVDPIAPAAAGGLALGRAQLLLLPSFYGFVGWLGALLVYLVSPYDQRLLPETWAVVAYTLFLFCGSMFLFSLSAKQSLQASRLRFEANADRVWFLVATVIGGFGLYLYVRDFSSYFGSFGSFLSILTQSSLEVRGAAQDVGGLGFQVSYLSWVAIFFGLILTFRSSLPPTQRVVLLAISAMLFILNLAFVDRTRPIWILVVCLFGYVVSTDARQIRPARVVASVAGIPLAIFFFFTIVSGKFDIRAGVFDNFIIYVTGGLGYFDSLMAEVTQGGFTFAQTFLPVTKLLKGMNVISEAPSEILDFRMVPFATNVGTFLQPLFADGGLPLLLIGLPVLVLGTDWLALASFRTRSLMGRFFWANLTFTMLIGFFVPKYNNTAIYVFAAVLLIDQFRRARLGLSGRTPVHQAR